MKKRSVLFSFLAIFAVIFMIFAACDDDGDKGSENGDKTISVTITPAAVSIERGDTQQFTVKVANTTNQAVTWSIVQSFTANPGTTITQTGLLTVAEGELLEELTIRARSQEDDDMVGLATVTLIGDVPYPPSEDPLVHTGFKSAKAVVELGAPDQYPWYISQRVAITAGEYIISIYHRGSEFAFAAAGDWDGGWKDIKHAQPASEDAWRLASFEFTIANDTDNFIFAIYGNGAGTFYVDDARLVKKGENKNFLVDSGFETGIFGDGDPVPLNAGWHKFSPLVTHYSSN